MSKLKHLFEQFNPKSYDLSIKLDKKNLKFSGSVKITGKKIGRPSKRITFHQRGLKIKSAKIIKQSKKANEQITVSRIVSQNSYDEVRLHSDGLIYPGEYIVELEFYGDISPHMLGIYPSYYEHEGVQKTIIATQFESHYAREVFPCIDEPIAKATFKLTLSTDKSDVVLSNTPEESCVIDKNIKTTTFETTPIMPTYLLAFISGPLHSMSGKTKNGITVTSWASLARSKKELEYSVEEAVKTLEFFADYFGTDYPLKKCDQVALPDFDAGAMENWGLVTYRETLLLSDPDNPSVSGEQFISLVIAHELSHQWFGNLVTMKWWDDLWLNESFASLMEHLALDFLHPDWKQWEAYTASDVINTSNRDIYKDIQPVGVKVTDPNLIDTLFDPGIVYAKGGRLLKMLKEYLGDDAFRSGLEDYFKKHAYGNTSRNDLWQALSRASGKEIEPLMTPWIEKPGMPIVTIDQVKKQVKLTQKRFILDQKEDPTIWPIPLLASQKLTNNILKKQTTTFMAESDEPIIVNQYGSGHFISKFTQEEHKKYIANSINKQIISAESRINILNDSILLAKSGESSLVDSLRLIEDCSTEPRDSVWALISRIIGLASQLTEGDESTNKSIKKFRYNLAIDWHKELGWQDSKSDDINTKQLRHTALAYILSSEDGDAIAKAQEIYQQNKDIADIDSEIRPTILSAVVKHGGQAEVNNMILAYKSVPADVQVDIALGLSSTKSHELAKEILSKALGESGFVRPQDYMRWLATFLRNRYTRKAAWDYITTQWNWIEKTLGASKSYDYLPVYCANVITTKEYQEKFHDLFDSKLTNKTLERNIKVGYSTIQSNIAWRDRDELKLAKYFKDQSKI